MKRNKVNTNQLRELAVSLGADRKKLYGASREALIIIIDSLKKGENKNEKTDKHH